MNDIIRAVEQKQLKTDLPVLREGDTVKVNVKVVEGSRERIQTYEGYIIAKKGGGLSETITVRRISYGCGVERTFPIHSPRIDSIVVVRHGKVRRAKLYFIRDRVGKAARIQDKEVIYGLDMFQPSFFKL